MIRRKFDCRDWVFKG